MLGHVRPVNTPNVPSGWPFCDITRAERVFGFRSVYYGRRRGLSRHPLTRLRHRSRPAGPKPCVHRLLICSRRRRYSIGHRTGGLSVSRTCRCASCHRSEARRAARTGNGHLLGATTRCSQPLLPRNPATPSASGERPLLPPSRCRDGTRHPRRNCGDMPTVQREPAAPAAPRRVGLWGPELTESVAFPA